MSKATTPSPSGSPHAKRRRTSATPATSTAAVPALPYVSAGSYSPKDAYDHFIKNHVVGKPELGSSKVTVKATDIPAGWTTFDPKDSQHLIAGDIAHKFNKETASSPLGGIYSVKPKLTTGNTLYWAAAAKNYKPALLLHETTPPPAPKILAHELIHANDHQVDRLNPKVWGDIIQLATDESLDTIDDVGGKLGLKSLLQPVQDIVDPKGTFSKLYPFSFNVIETGEDNGKGKGGLLAATVKRSTVPNRKTIEYNIPTLSGTPGASEDVDWSALGAEIQDYTNTTTPLNPKKYGVGKPKKPVPQLIPNMYFDANLASEFPAFISENLSNQWNANSTVAGATPLNSNQAHFLYKTLGHMENAYPVREYPTMGKYIQARRNSLYNRYKPSTGGAHPFGVTAPDDTEAAADHNVKYFGKP